MHAQAQTHKRTNRQMATPHKRTNSYMHLCAHTNRIHSSTVLSTFFMQSLSQTHQTQTSTSAYIANSYCLRVKYFFCPVTFRTLCHKHFIFLAEYRGCAFPLSLACGLRKEMISCKKIRGGREGESEGERKGKGRGGRDEEGGVKWERGRERGMSE